MIDKNKRIYVAGGSSMLGRATIDNLKSKGYNNIIYPTHEECDWLIYEQGYDSLNKYKPKYLFNFLGHNGGLPFNRKFPADIYQKSAYLALNILSIGSTFCEKIISILPSCSYSAYKNNKAKEILNEEEFDDGPPHESVACHGLAKKIIFDYSRMLYKQFGINSVCCIANNSFGGFAHYENEDRLKVCDALIKKIILAKRNQLPSVELFGTGAPLRELMYKKDVAEGVVFVFENYEDNLIPINIAPGHEISVRELSIFIKQIVGYQGKIIFNSNYPDGQMRKKLSSEKISALGWRPMYNLETALRETIDWYNETYPNV